MTSSKRESFVLGYAVFGVGILSCLAFGLILGHRMDYVGHYAAGFGGTLGLLVVVVAAVPRSLTRSDLHAIVLVVTLVSIGLGAAMEATIFRIAQFDLIDFFNQSIGAVLAALSFTVAHPSTPLRVSDFGTGLAGAALFLIAGFIFAFS